MLKNGAFDGGGRITEYHNGTCPVSAINCGLAALTNGYSLIFRIC
jgi:hypothetical protein